MKEFNVVLTVERIVEAKVEAKDIKEAKKKAMLFSNLRDEETLEETIQRVDSCEEEK